MRKVSGQARRRASRKSSAHWRNSPSGATCESQPDIARFSTLSDYYRAHYLYRLSQGGEAVESALAVFERTLRHRAELQTVALEDIASGLQTLRLS
ncbi:DUF2397 family protein [Polaromonas naphthalenivorans]|uniref:DUF2397 family protein n=1 Tax=Polaromonas naphthalenivorans TaxID=216465 RepID=UPI0003169189